MKLFNIFKKENTKSTNTNIQKMDKKQLKKVVGGGDGTDVTYDETTGGVVKSKSNIRNN